MTTSGLRQARVFEMWGQRGERARGAQSTRSSRGGRGALHVRPGLARRLRGALEAFGGPRAAELRVVRAAHQAAVGGDALERGAVEDAAEDVGGDQPDGAPLGDLRAEGVCEMVLVCAKRDLRRAF